MIESIKARPHEALRSYLAARDLVVRTHEASNIAGIETGLATTYKYLGDTENERAHQLLALKAGAAGSSYMRRQSPVMVLAMASVDLRHYRLAALLLDRVERDAERERDPLFQATAIKERNRILVAQKRPREAMQQLERAEGVIAAVQQTATTARIAGDIALAKGEVLSTYDPAGAIELLGLAREQLQELRLRDRRARISLLMGRARQAAGDPAGAEAELRAGIDEVEDQRNQIADPEERSTFTDTTRALFDDMVQLLVRRGAAGEALAMARRARAIALTESGTVDGSSGPGLEAGNSFPPSSLYLEYYVLPDGVLIWATEHGRTRMFRQAIAADALAARVRSHVNKIANCVQGSDCLDNSAALFDLLLRPLGATLSSSQELIVPPDGILHYVPFAALYDRSIGKYLIEDHTVTLTLGSRVTPAGAPFRSILVATAPNPGSGLAPLGAVEQEARSAARKFAVSHVLTRGEVTSDAILAAAGDFEIVHYAGHAVWNERNPRLAALRLAPAGPHTDGSLYAYEVAGRRFPKTRLVVLAGCDTARGRLAGVGLLSFTRTFLAAGVPEVIGSLWPARDQESARFFGEFYAALARHPSPPAALRHAQREALVREGPAVWATYQLYDGGAR